MAPLVSLALRIANRGAIEDNFNRSLTGTLGSTSTGGVPWSILTGVWNVDGSRPTTATSMSSNPLAVIEASTPNVESTLTIGAGDALYFRVLDANNWWRVLWYGWQTSSCQSCCSTCCSTCTSYCTVNNYRCIRANPQGFGAENCGGCPSCSSPYWCEGHGSCQQACGTYSCNCYSCNCYSCNCTYYDNYQAQVEVCSGGSVAGVQTTSRSGATAAMKVTLRGNQITVSHGGTVLYDAARTEHNTATKHGIGRGSSSYNTSAIDNFTLSRI